MFLSMRSVLEHHHHAIQTVPILYLAIVVADAQLVTGEVLPPVLASSKRQQQIRLVKILTNVQKVVTCVTRMRSALIPL